MTAASTSGIVPPDAARGPWREIASQLACALETVLDHDHTECDLPDWKVAEAVAALEARIALEDQPTHDDTEVSQ